MNDKLNNVTILPPFKKFCMTIGELPSSYLESMTYYESLLWLTKYLGDTIIPALNANGEAVIELQEKYIELKNYVDNYFENLDVQEEINNKLDDMADSGELVSIIGAYLTANSILGFDTKADLKAAENLISGSICKTIGDLSYNDGKGNFYRIRDLEIGDVIDDNNLVGLTNFDSLVAEKLPDYRMNTVESDISTLNNTTIPSIESEIENLSDEFNNNKVNSLNLMNYITYDFGLNYYIQGMAIDSTNLYVYKEYSDSNGKLMKFNLSTDTFTSETSVDLKHGNDMTIINGVLYSTNCDSTKKLTAYNLSNGNSNEISLDIEESQIACITKEDDSNLLVLGNSGYGSNLSNCSFYRYNLTNSTLTKLSLTNNGLLNFYAIQSFVYLNGYLYLLVSNPNQILKFKVNDSSLIFENLYNIPDVDNLGLFVGEIEGVDVAPSFGENALMITTQIKDSDEIGRTMKTYIIDPIKNTPEFYLHYPDINLVESIDDSFPIIVNNSSSSLIELGTNNYPFRTLARAINAVRNNFKNSNSKAIVIFNGLNAEPFNLYYKVIKNVNCDIQARSNNIVINYQRIVDSNITFNGVEWVLNLKNSVYANKVPYGSIASSKVDFIKCNLIVQDGLCIVNSTVTTYTTTGEASNSDTYIFKEFQNTNFIDTIDWDNDFVTAKKYHELSGAASLEKRSGIALDGATQSSWFSSHVSILGGSTAYRVTFGGLHTSD